MSFDSSSCSRHVLRLLHENGFRVSVFHNPGSLLGTMPAFVETHAVLDSVEPPHKFMVRVYVAEHEHPEYAGICLLAEACGFELRE